jgi:alkylation response protein AidB-like acyl-CoA dehydrogenase
MSVQDPRRIDTQLRDRFSPVFERIRQGTVARELNRTLLFEEVSWLREQRFGALRLPVEHGGHGASLVQLFDLLIDLGAAESNLPQALRLHFHRVEHLLNAKPSSQRKNWLDRVAQGDLFGNATTEARDGRLGEVRTKVVSHNDGSFRLSGRKAYGTGSLYAQLIPVEAVDEQGDRLTAIVPADRKGVNLVDDWGGFGQRLTATGSSIFDSVIVQPTKS